MKFGSLFIVICGLLLSVDAQSTVTPSDVYSRVKAIESVIKKMSGNRKQRIATIKLIDAKPLHVYAIGTALNEKILILNELGNKSQYIRPDFPSKDITPAQVLTLMLAIEHNLKLFNIEADFTSKVYKNKKPKDVLRVLVRCNLLLDNLLDKKILPSSPYRVVGQIEKLLTKAVQTDFPTVVKQQYPLYNSVKPNDVFVNAENMFNPLMSATSLKFGIDYPSRPYYSPYNNKHIKPIHVFTITVMNRVLLQDLMRRQGQGYLIEHNDTRIDGIEPANVYQRYEKALMLMRLYLLK
ncbi:hypothetical protein MHM98_05565 [Psychrobium sp. MM17-31]|uniref:hypothetical protein n=1 Tax=Psychrobium sp. MM17-31 TaxID=2917758 RepID=UPI001EF62BEB|nr:hypothetical protein [Psychrobium sp. MM17-31]MCG7530825.1 hypothetical protein [Psychrobium sp. MM17-31]